MPAERQRTDTDAFETIRGIIFVGRTWSFVGIENNDRLAGNGGLEVAVGVIVEADRLFQFRSVGRPGIR